MNKVYATDVYEYLPHSNCKRCGEDSCMAFAVQLCEGKAKLNQCGPLRLKEQANNRAALSALLRDLDELCDHS